MKKLSLLFVLLLSFHFMAGQLQQESFDTSGLPDGWTSININGSKEWHFGYKGVMPHSGPTIESEFSAGAALFINSEKSNPHQERISLKAPPVDLTEAEGARIEVTYNLQVEDDKGNFSIEVFDGKSWQQVFFQDSSSPKNTGLNEMVSFDVSEFSNEDFQVKFVYDDEGSSKESGLGISHYRLIEASDFQLSALSDLRINRYIHPTDNVLVLNDDGDIEELDVIDSLRGHSREYESFDRSHEAHELPTSAVLFRVEGGELLGSYKVLKQE
jgi:uncharacterized protein YqkB